MNKIIALIILVILLNSVVYTETDCDNGVCYSHIEISAYDYTFMWDIALYLPAQQIENIQPNHNGEL